eukprot:15365612-Ditylum_brightwellii.AAC.1
MKAYNPLVGWMEIQSAHDVHNRWNWYIISDSSNFRRKSSGQSTQGSKKLQQGNAGYGQGRSTDALIFFD